ncbi:carbohydrate porin, partial [Bradyrhizobium brasilense]|uniref:carbohydrate porin n=1 Tax=Bradyrhizobium brasilense TaxID=1419277 RepID=UPI001F266D47
EQADILCDLLLAVQIEAVFQIVLADAGHHVVDVEPRIGVLDRSVSGGVSIKGSRWGRANDTIGIGGAINGLSSAHRDYLAAG